MKVNIGECISGKLMADQYRRMIVMINSASSTDDHSRVIVWDIPVTVGTDYYNASFVDVSVTSMIPPVECI